MSIFPAHPFIRGALCALAILFNCDLVAGQVASAPEPAQAVLWEKTTTRSANTEPWWQDARWWAIGASVGLGLLSLGLQFRYRITDRWEKTRAERFDREVSDPLRETYKDLRSMATEVSTACDLSDMTLRSAAVQKVQETSACKALTSFSQALLEAECRLEANGQLSDLNANLEDVLYPELSGIAGAHSTAELRASSRRVSAAVVVAITASDKFLGVAREKYGKPDGRWKRFKRVIWPA